MLQAVDSASAISPTDAKAPIEALQCCERVKSDCSATMQQASRGRSNSKELAHRIAHSVLPCLLANEVKFKTAEMAPKHFFDQPFSIDNMDNSSFVVLYLCATQSPGHFSTLPTVGFFQFDFSLCLALASVLVSSPSPVFHCVSCSPLSVASCLSSRRAEFGSSTSLFQLGPFCSGPPPSAWLLARP